MGDFVQLSLVDISGIVSLAQAEIQLNKELFKKVISKYYLAQY